MNSQILVKINSFIKNRLFELSGILLIIISVFLLVSIITYSGGQGNFIYKAENAEIDYAKFWRDFMVVHLLTFCSNR